MNYIAPFTEFFMEIPHLYVVCTTNPNSIYFRRLNETALNHELIVTPINELSVFIKDKLATDMLLFVDGENTLITGDAKQLISQFRWFQEQFGDKLVCAAEPDGFLNPCFISSVSCLRRILQGKGPLSELLTLHSNQIVLDSGNLIFNSIDVTDLETKDGQWFNKKTRTFPLVFHADNSVAKTFLFSKI